MRLRSRLMSPLLVRTTATTTSTASSPPAVLSVGHALRERRSFTEDDVASYAAVSGDRNPVHLDDAVARELVGFQRGRVVHGMLVASLSLPSSQPPSLARCTRARRSGLRRRCMSEMRWLLGSRHSTSGRQGRRTAARQADTSSSSQPNASWTKRRRALLQLKG